MSDSALAHVALSYQPVWGPARDLVAIVLDVRPQSDTAFDGAQLCAILRDCWPERAPQLLLHVHSSTLLCELLRHAGDGPAWLVLDDENASTTLVQSSMPAACQPVPLVRRCQLGEPVPQRRFSAEMLSLSMPQTVALLAKASRPVIRKAPADPDAPPPPVRFYEGIASERLAAWCLDQEQAAGIIGWPAEEAAHRLWHAPMPPDQAVILTLLRCIDMDASIETLETWLGSDPVLAYRFLRYANSALLGLRSEVGSLRHGLMMVGAATLRTWLGEQFPLSSADLDFRPVRETSVLRARLAENLVDAGTEHELRRELHLCGLFADLDVLLGSRLCELINPLPVAQRIADAMVGRRGPYASYLALARAMADPASNSVALVCEAEGIALEQANRGLLHMLCGLQVEHPALA